MKRLLLTVLLGLGLTACSLSIPNPLPDPEPVNAVIVADLLADPVSYQGQKIVVVGWFDFAEFESKLRFNPDPSESVNLVGIHMDTLKNFRGSGFDGQIVEVTGRVETECWSAHRMAARDKAADPEKVTWISGYCNATDLVRLQHADIRRYKEPS